MRYLSIYIFFFFYNKYYRKQQEAEGSKLRLRDIREDHDVTQKMLAAYLHIGQNTYSQYETGRRQLPIDILIRLAEYFDTSTDYILGLTDESKPYPKR